MQALSNLRRSGIHKRTLRMLLLNCQRFMQDGGATIIDPDNPLQHVASNTPPTSLSSSASPLQHHYTEMKQSVHNLVLCIEKEIREESATHVTPEFDGSNHASLSPYFPADASDTDFAWKCQHVVGSRWLRLHRMWKPNVEDGAQRDDPDDKACEEHIIEVALPSLDHRYDESQQDLHSTGHHPFTLTIIKHPKLTSIQLLMDIVNGEIVLDSICPLHRDRQFESKSKVQSVAPDLSDHGSLATSFESQHLTFRGPCLTNSQSDEQQTRSNEHLANDQINQKNKMYSRLLSFLSERGLLNSDKSSEITRNVASHEKWNSWILKQISFYEQKEYERWLNTMKDFVQ